MNSEIKLLAGVLAGTIVLIVGGAFLMGGQGSVDSGAIVADGERLARSDDPALGPEDARVTVTEFSDFYCPSCKAVAVVLKQVVDEYEGKSVKFVFRNFPLTQSLSDEKALPAHAALAAQRQGKFWEYHYTLFENQPNLSRDNLLKFAEELGMDRVAFEEAMDSSEVKDAVRQDKSDATSLGLQGTPTFFINGIEYTGERSVEGFSEAINQALEG